MKKNGIFNALDIAAYLNHLHNNLYNCNISPLKLQKVLFFLFGEWGAFIKKASMENDGSSLMVYSPYLFNDEFQAWVYGPVVKKVYDEFKNQTVTEDEIFKNEKEKYVGLFINDLAKELFQLSDFRLVEISHQMKCWYDNFNQDDLYHNIIINKDSIINEFAGQI